MTATPGAAEPTPGAAEPTPVGELLAVVDRLVKRVADWTPARWSVTTTASTRADLVHDLVQRLADLSADVEGCPRREVPRLENDLALRDQLRVIVGDLVGVRPPGSVVTEATDLVRQVNRAL